MGILCKPQSTLKVLQVRTSYKGQMAKVVCGPLQVLLVNVLDNNIFRAYLNNENEKWLVTEQIPHEPCPTLPAGQLLVPSDQRGANRKYS